MNLGTHEDEETPAELAIEKEEVEEAPLDRRSKIKETA